MLKAPTRRIASAIDLLDQDYDSAAGGLQITELPLEQIQSFHDHRFHLYAGQRLEDMMESIKAHGVLTPVIVQRLDKDRYEMLSGHNRRYACQMLGLTTIPALVKEHLTENEALAYVIETNLMQRSFTDMLPSEQAAVLGIRYEKLISQGRRNDICHEIVLLEKGEDSTSAPVGQKLDTRSELGKEYGLGHSSVARLLCLNHLIEEFRHMVDSGSLALRVADDLSFLSIEEQTWVYQAATELHFKLTMSNIKLFRQTSIPLTKEFVYGLMQGSKGEKRVKPTVRKVNVSRSVYDQYFKERTEEEIQSVIDQALAAWFAAGN
jgi:ParB family chromosome partitioning protein